MRRDVGGLNSFSFIRRCTKGTVGQTLVCQDNEFWWTNTYGDYPYDAYEDAVGWYIASAMVIPCTMQYTGMGVTRIYQGSGSNVRVGLYTDTYRYPGKLIIDSGALSMAATGIVTCTFTNPIFLQGGKLYWAVLHHNGLGTYSGYDGSLGKESWNKIAVIGTDTAGEMGGFGYCYHASSWGALPSTFPSGAEVSVRGANARIFLKPALG